MILHAVVRVLCMRQLGSIDDKLWDSLMRLPSHVEEYRRSSKSLWKTADLSASKAQQWTESLEAKETITALYCRVKLNCMSLTPLDDECLGIGLDVLGATMNHSCDPNAVCIFEGKGFRVRSLRPILAGEEITISYTENTLDRSIRQRVLRANYFFDCECEKPYFLRSYFKAFLLSPSNPCSH